MIKGIFLTEKEVEEIQRYIKRQNELLEEMRVRVRDNVKLDLMYSDFEYSKGLGNSILRIIE
jgi:hypothetical protein